MENKINFHLGFTYNERRRSSLVGVEGHIGAGKFMVLCGCSGCGKSTLLRCINHLIPEFYEGELTGFCRINGNDLSDCSIGAVGKRLDSVCLGTGHRCHSYGRADRQPGSRSDQQTSRHAVGTQIRRQDDRRQ